MKIRIIKLGPEFLIKALRGRTNSFATNLPDDAELLGIKYDLFSNQVLAIIRSDSFKDTVESGLVEEFTVTYAPEFDVVYAPGSRQLQPMVNSKIQPLPAINSKPESQSTKEMRILQNPDISEVEKEFSPEQRNLLTFTVKDENVLVKPTQFLKTDWDDINDVAKSLGGKWVKGDIISYWAIPIRQS
jgi:hypothetical protein